MATSLPYLWNFASTPPGYRYTWILPPYPEDSFGYMAWSQQAAHGALLFKVKYTAVPQSAFLFHPFFLICGWLSRLAGGNIGVVHLVMKEIGVVLFLMVFYRYSDFLRLNEFQSLAATILLGISSGIGGFFGFFASPDQVFTIPADLTMPELSTYWSLLWNPLFPYSLLLMLLAIYFLDRGTRESRKRDLWFAGLSAGVLALIHPYSQPLLLAFAVILVMLRRKADWLGYLFRFGAVLSPFLLYVVLLSVFQPVVAEHSAQGTMSSPNLAAYLLGFGIPLLIWAAGFAVGRGRWMKEYWQLVLWFLLSVALAYLPFWFQRKLIFGAHIPLCILAAISFDLMLAKISRPAVRRLSLAGAVIVLIPLLAITPIFVLISIQRDVKNNADGVYYLSDELTAGLKFLKQQNQPDRIVMATIATSRMIPALSGNTVVWGHWAMTVDLAARTEWYKQLFNRPQDWDDPKRAGEFWDTGIQYIFADGNLREAIERNPWKWRVILQDADEVFRNGTVVIYKRRAG
ncbi:MAG: hypothetical protein WA655_07715 [Candidatus Korobacteraceae bacterium]